MRERETEGRDRGGWEWFRWEVSRRREKCESEWWTGGGDSRNRRLVLGPGGVSGRVAPAKAKARKRDDKARQLGGLGAQLALAGQSSAA